MRGRRVAGRKSGGDPYTVTLPEFGAAALREQRALGIPFDPVFPTRNGTHQSEANLRSHWREMAAAVAPDAPVGTGAGPSQITFTPGCER